MASWQFSAHGEVGVKVSNEAGSIELTSHDGAAIEVEVSAVDGGADELIERVRVEERGGPERTQLIVEVPRAGSATRGGGILSRLLRDHPDVRVSIRLPHGADVDASTGSAGIRAEGRFGSFDARSASGEIEIDHVAGDFRARTASGGVLVLSVEGRSRVETASGDVVGRALNGDATVSTASGQVEVDVVGAPIVVKTASGDVLLGDVMSGCRVQSASGDQRLQRCAGGTVQLQTVSGDLVIGVARGTAVQVDAETVTGDLSSEIDLDGAATEAQDGGPRLELRARTVSGDVRVERADAR